MLTSDCYHRSLIGSYVMLTKDSKVYIINMEVCFVSNCSYPIG